ncbi:hypothetical protein P8452_15689 [Trifolium repens]|nr:hypothetical protein P8452_15689 [Trifolium repens]
MVVAALPLLLHFCRELLVYGLMTSKKENIQKKIKNKGMETCSKRRHGHRCHVRNNMSSSSIFAIVKWRKLFKGMPLVYSQQQDPK